MAGYQRQVMDIKVGKGFTSNQSDEHKRNWQDRRWEVARSYGNYDRTREHLNFEIVNGTIVPVDKDKNIAEAIRENLAARGIKDPNAGYKTPKYRTVVNIVFGGSRARMHELAFGEQSVDLAKDADNSHIKRCEDIEKWALDIYNFVADRYGEENIAAFIVHLDEVNPHVHCTLLPIQDGKFAYKKIFAGKDLHEYKDRMRELHDALAKVNEKWGLVRGSDISKTGVRHITVEEYRRMLARECDDLERQIEESKALLLDLENEVAHARKRVKGLTTMIENLERERGNIEDEISRLNAQLHEGNGDIAEIQKRLGLLSRQYSDVVERLDDKRKKLTDANKKLAEFKALEEESREQVEAYRQQADDYRDMARAAIRDTTEQYQFRINDTAMTALVRELQSISPLLEQLKSETGDMLIYDLATNGTNILKCAAMLFAGYVDGATTFAETHGGGGTDTQGWGRKEDEDDIAFRFRCLHTAARMMRPASGKSVKRR